MIQDYNNSIDAFIEHIINIHPNMYMPLDRVKPLKRGHYAGIRCEPKLSRNALCDCGSGKKYKHCCIDNNLGK